MARYKVDGRGYRLHEISRFQQRASGWRYLDGERGPTDNTAGTETAPGAADHERR